MLGLLRQPLLKSVKIAQFGVKNFAQPIPRVLQRSYGSNKWSDCMDPDFLSRIVIFGTFSTIVYEAVVELQTKLRNEEKKKLNIEI